MAQNTERAIANALKKLLAKRPLNKITINDITNECGINRMTFYYHYHDVYDLIESICDESLKGALEGKRDLKNWQAGILQLMETIKKDKDFYIGVYQSVDMERSYGYMFRLIRDLLKEGMDQVDDAGPLTLAEQDFIADFYAHAFCGILMQWIQKEMETEPAVLVERLSKIGENELARAMKALAPEES